MTTMKAYDMLEDTARMLVTQQQGQTLELFDARDDIATDDFNDIALTLEELSSWCPEDVRVVADLTRYYRRKSELIARTIDPTVVANPSYGSALEDSYVLTVQVVVPVSAADRAPIELANLIRRNVDAAQSSAKSSKEFEIAQLEARLNELRA